jgi:hypothetical protein
MINLSGLQVLTTQTPNFDNSLRVQEPVTPFRTALCPVGLAESAMHGSITVDILALTSNSAAGCHRSKPFGGGNIVSGSPPTLYILRPIYPEKIQIRK